MTEAPIAAILIMGDEILSGRTRDANMHYLAGQLTEKGIKLCEVRVIMDEHERIKDTVAELSKTYTHVFTSGGIGPTHDDITADAVAAAFDDPIDIRDDAREILKAHYEKSGSELTAARLRMARIPDSASLIENPVSSAPGFTLGNVHVMAGVPSVFQAMVASLLPKLTGSAPMLSESLRIILPESEIAEPLGVIAAKYPKLSFGSYPFITNGVFGANIVVRGTDPVMLAKGVSDLREIFADSA